MEGELGWSITQVYGLTETAPFISICEPLPEHESLSPAERSTMKAKQGVELITSGELRVVDDNVNRTFYFSVDGLKWFQIYQAARTTFITPTGIGFLSGTGNPQPTSVTLLSWLEG